VTVYRSLVISDVCKIVGLKPWAIYNRVKKGRFPQRIQETNERWAIWALEDILAWLAENGKTPQCDLAEFEWGYIYPEPEKYTGPDADETIIIPENDPNTVEHIFATKRVIGNEALMRPAIYFLLHENAIVYVGKALMPLARLASHMNVKTFDSFTLFPCPKEHLDLFEAYYLFKFRPKYNCRIGRGLMQTLYSKRRLEQIDMKEMFKMIGDDA